MAGKTEYKREWNEHNLDRIYLTVPQGRKTEIQAIASAQDPKESLNSFIVKAINERMERLGKK